MQTCGYGIILTLDMSTKYGKYVDLKTIIYDSFSIPFLAKRVGGCRGKQQNDNSKFMFSL